jgi:hypothetical protein
MSRPTRGSGLRAEKEAVLHLPSPPSRVFPLLCPERERDWIAGWDYEMVYSASGYAEPGCIFVTTAPPEGLTIWEFVEHVPDRHLVINRITPGLVSIRWQMDLSEPAEGTTALAIRWTVTGLSPEGNRYIREGLDERFRGLTAWLENLLDHYLRTGTALPAGS